MCSTSLQATPPSLATKESNINMDTLKHPSSSKQVAASRSTSQKVASYEVSISIGFVSVLVLLATSTSFQVGAMVRHNILQQLQLGQQEQPSWVQNNDISDWLLWAFQQQQQRGGGITQAPSGQWIHCQDHEQDSLCQIIDDDESSDSSSDKDSESDDDTDEDNETNDNGESFGQQVLATLKHSDNDYDSQEDLVASLLKLTASKGWTLITHYCQEDTACVLFFEKGHRIILNRSTQTMDIFSTEAEALVDWLNSAMSHLVQSWAYKPRATPFDANVVDAGLNDLYNFMLGSLEFTQKQLVVREESPFQEVAIYDTIDPRILSYAAYQQASQQKSDNDSEENSYYKENAHLFQPDRQMFLDGVVQSRLYGERAYHEALVHPAMVMHPHPQRVAIVGAGEGATLREVLKHASLKEVVMIEIDPYVMDLSRKYLTQWNDCSDLELPEGLVNPTGNCFDDPRATVHAEDAIAWLMERYPENSASVTATHELFDVIIMDALDPGDKREFSDILFKNTELVATFHRALSPQGIFGCQTGEQQYLDDTNPMWTRDKHALLFLQNLGKVGFRRFFDYDEASTRFSGLWSYLLASKDSDTSRWYASPAQIDLELQLRAMPTKSGEWPFRYFDGATMQSYQTTSRPVATVMCRTTPDWPACQRGTGLAGGSTNVPVVEGLALQEGAVVALQDLEPGTHLGLDECVGQTWDIPHNAAIVIDALVTSLGASFRLTPLARLIHSFGMPALLRGERAMSMDMGQDVWMKQCPVTHSLLEPIVEGVSNAMLDRFWRIHTCAATRSVKQRFSAGSEVPCRA